MSDETTRRHPNVISAAEAKARTMEKGTKIGATITPLAAASGGTLLGCNQVEVPPGKRAFPLHFHCAIEESIYVLEGTGTLRIGEERVEVGAGDYVTFPPGPDTAHQLINTGEAPLRYLCMSSKATTDVVGYPDSKKIMAAGGPSLSFFDPPWVRSVFKEGTEVDYFEGEEV